MNAANSNYSESSLSAITWPAIIAGAFAASAISVVVLLLGSALGLALASPWAGSGSSAVGFTVKAAMWLILTQWVASALGGYLTGRLRVKWAGLDEEEVFFRDTAHGFLAWAVATVFATSVFAVGAHFVANRGVQSAATVASANGAARSSTGSHDPLAYFTDSMFRSERLATNGSEQEVREETGRIMLKDMKDGLPENDRRYLTQLVSIRTGLTPADASRRVDEVMETARKDLRQAADTARKSGMYFSISLCISMLIGAFIASVAAAIGGRQRDEY